ncbi:Abhydrolase domain-containing protein 11 [Habropoda laboriosa]|uniref:sn-1-specific diacylglycerol lipase ABHD11 n=1 Tax=Habropoda laboriosa TaxID=597456 RepID=A0A0L7R136_9HYME|nr:PREDICTED: protein ABHD11 [Habropoda laboriosa]KOC64570.1 Abhydrolase domain-containing protein 11 [Habropoda laboriosa]
MSGMCCRYLIMTRNIFPYYRKQDFIINSSFTSYLSSKQIRNNSDSVTPVKLAYASYESMNETNVSKHPIIIMHGLFGSKTNWNTLSKTIHQQTNRKVITVDARNHGDSPHSTDMTYSYMAQDVVQLMNDLGFEKSVLIGHSMGGSAMMYVALHYPKLIEKLIVVDMSPVRTSPHLMDMEKIFRVMRMINLDGSTTLTKARTVVKEQLATVVKSLSLRQFLAMNLVEADIGKYKWRVNLPVLEQNFSTQIAVFPNVGLKVYNGPTLFIGGSNSDYIRVEDHNKIKQLFPSAKIFYINGANHWVHVDKPVEFLKMTVDFINQP